MNTSNRSSAINRCHWFVAAMLAVVTCGVSFGEEAKVETNDEKLLALCRNPEATPEAIEALLKAGADIEARSKIGFSPLMLAARWNNSPEVIEVLLKAGADIEARDGNGLTPLMFAAAMNSNPEVGERVTTSQLPGTFYAFLVATPGGVILVLTWPGGGVGRTLSGKCRLIL